MTYKELRYETKEWLGFFFCEAAFALQGVYAPDNYEGSDEDKPHVVVAIVSELTSKLPDTWDDEADRYTHPATRAVNYIAALLYNVGCKFYTH